MPSIPWPAVQSTLRRLRPYSPWIGGTAILTSLVITGLIVHHKFFEWKRWHVVSEGVLYRSGILHDWQVESALRDRGIKTVFSFTHTNNSAEQRICDAHGVRREYCYLPGDGVGPDDPYLRFLEVMQDPNNYPVLVHCSAGVQRTGGAVALYRVVYEGWDFDRAIEEMIAKGNEGEEVQIEQLRQVCERLQPMAVARAESRTKTHR